MKIRTGVPCGRTDEHTWRS